MGSNQKMSYGPKGQVLVWVHNTPFRGGYGPTTSDRGELDGQRVQNVQNSRSTAEPTDETAARIGR